MAQRLRLATGDTVERLLQQFAAAEDAGVITDSEGFSGPALQSLPAITSFQAARRLAALGVPAASASPSVTVLAGSPLAALVSDWLDRHRSLGHPEPAAELPERRLHDLVTDRWPRTDEGYLDLDLDALTQGYVIPPFAASPTAVHSGSTLTFASGSGIGAGMPVSRAGHRGRHHSPERDHQFRRPAGVTLSADAPGVTTATVLVFNFAIAPVTATATAACPAGQTALALGATTGISAGMTVLGAGIAPGTTVTDVTPTAVTLSTGGDRRGERHHRLRRSLPARRCPRSRHHHALPVRHSSLLTFAAATGISVGMSAVRRDVRRPARRCWP